MAATPGRDNSLERSLRSELHRRGFRFRLHRRVLPGTTRSIDIAFVDPRVAIFVDGCFWHGCPLHSTWPKNNAAWWRDKIETNRKRDRDTDGRLISLGWIVIRVWEHEDAIAAADRITIAIRKRLRDGTNDRAGPARSKCGDAPGSLSKHHRARPLLRYRKHGRNSRSSI
jgi:DNA mismatch endonuclease (patch repair protein)